MEAVPCCSELSKPTVDKILYIGGRFDDKGGKPSKIANQIFEAVGDADYYNGGYFKDLEEIVKSVGDYKLVYWFADVPNEKDKLVKRIKAINRQCVLVTSKRNRGEYNFNDILFHALNIKSNLVIEFIKNKKERYEGRVLDPLGNVFISYNEDFGLIGRIVGKRANELLGYTRISSEKIGDKIEVPDEKEFFELIKGYAEVFHDLTHANPETANRFFGNASFRCTYGFPSFRKNGLIFVSKRNIDKRYIERDNFVGVKLEIPVKYFGINKPSVDTPIQVRLYQNYQNVNYMIHSHVYVENAPFTKKVIPCGAIEEANEIIELFPKDSVNFFVNLRGHGSLALVDNVEKLKGIPYKTRGMPEIQEYKI